MTLPQMIDVPATFDNLETDEERFEFAMYVVNTAPVDRPEVSDEDAVDALAWMRENVEEDFDASQVDDDDPDTES